MLKKIIFLLTNEKNACFLTYISKFFLMRIHKDAECSIKSAFCLKINLNILKFLPTGGEESVLSDGIVVFDGCEIVGEDREIIG